MEREKKNVIFLTTYPFEVPRHGGQVRAFELVQAYKEAGFRVVSIAVYEQESNEHEAIGSDDLPFPENTPFRLFGGKHIPLINDLNSGVYAADDRGGFAVLQKKVENAFGSISLIHCEQPWLFDAAARLKAEVPSCASALMVYGSQNVEHLLKQTILESYGIRNHEVIDAIRRLELRACRGSDVSLAVTEEDASWLTRNGAKRIIIARNGVTATRAKESLVHQWRAKLPAAPWLLYIASAHPPNFKGFRECIGGSLASIPPDSSLVVAGSVCEHLYHELAGSHLGSINLSRLKLLYVLSDDDLAAVKSLATGFLVPITSGGGSNLKTAEAIYSGKPVICTDASLRGYEKVKTLPEVLLANTPTEFHSRIREVLTGNVRLRPAGKEVRKELTWQYTLRSFIDMLVGISCPKEGEREHVGLA